MTQETIENPKGSKTDFSFFPAQDEKDFVATASAETMIDAIEAQPELCVQYLHELWRNNRDEDLYNCFKSEKVHRTVLRNILLSSFSSSIAYIHLEHKEPIEKCGQFLLETFTLYIKANNSIPKDDVLDLESHEAVDLSVGQILGIVADMKNRYLHIKAGLN